MKIVFIGGRDIDKIGGIENYMLNLATQLVKLGHEPIVFCESDRNEEEWVNGFRVIHRIGPSSRFLCKPILGFKNTLYTIFKLKGTDFIHYNTWSPALSAPIGRLAGINCVMQGHGLGWKRPKYSPKQQKLMKCLEFMATKVNNHLVMCSDDQTRYYKAEYGREAVTVPTAINPPDLEKPLVSDVAKRFGIKPKRFFLYLARLVQDKNPDFLIRAFREAQLQGYQLVVAGNNPADEAYVRSLHELGAGAEDVIFTDAVYGDDKEWLLRNAFAFCIPSTIEGLSISLLEAMSYGLPIVASRIEANREVLEEGDAWWCDAEDVASLRDALRGMAAAPEGVVAERTARTRRRVLDHYTWPQVARRYAETLAGWLG